MIAVVNVVNLLLATAMWLVFGRLVLGLFIRDPGNPVWQLFLIATAPVYGVSRALTGGRVSERWLWLVSTVWLLALRIGVSLLHRLAPP